MAKGDDVAAKITALQPAQTTRATLFTNAANAAKAYVVALQALGVPDDQVEKSIMATGAYLPADFPKWKYKSGQKPQLVTTTAQDTTLAGAGWVDTPQ